ncbi:class I SAM-dependent methyltransferase [Kribbella sp. VKM Ac-2569]|uniref:class I SAM-dependent methyltransferase n=1 Tax=Kribbella sp. VKM Ac-2569 TaxID=2512220 RepID=UPI00102CB309|nr:class I SAM-dependent methyltransferase [Kribbella sp. VKM Ac-2569]
MKRLAAEAKGLVVQALDRVTVRLGFGHSQERLVDDAKAYWVDGMAEPTWRGFSHFRDAGVFQTTADWTSVGREHWDLFERLERLRGGADRYSRIVEWGCGGGANALAFAPHCDEFVGVDVNPQTLDECGHQLEAVPKTKFTPVLADMSNPEAAAEQVGQVDVFICLYVLELVPSPEYGLRLMQIAHDRLKDGGVAFVQTKYQTANWRTASRRHRYRGSRSSGMTSYPIDTFWTQMTDLGFQPEACYLVPHNPLDERYAYYLLSKR